MQDLPTDEHEMSLSLHPYYMYNNDY